MKRFNFYKYGLRDKMSLTCVGYVYSGDGYYKVHTIGENYVLHQVDHTKEYPYKLTVDSQHADDFPGQRRLVGTHCIMSESVLFVPTNRYDLLSEKEKFLIILGDGPTEYLMEKLCGEYISE